MTYSVKNILWATDFSAEATNALAYAALFAKTCRARLSAIHVQPELEPALLESRPALLEDIYRQAGVNLGKARKRLDDLIAISTTTHSKLARFFLGNNTERVISFSEVPVFAIPAACSEG